MLTARDIQDLLQVDRSTVYRMAEDGRLPAIKVGKQWRFPASQVNEWLGTDITLASTKSATEATGMETAVTPEKVNDLAAILPLECVQLIQDSHASLLGVMLVITDMQGNPITTPSNPCGLFAAVNKIPGALQKCVRSWHDMATMLSMEPQFHKTHLEMLCTRGLIRVGTELKGMVVAGCVAPDVWPPTEATVAAMAREFGVEPALLTAHLHEAYQLDKNQKTQVLVSVQKIANIVAHIVNERQMLLGRLTAIANLTKL